MVLHEGRNSVQFVSLNHVIVPMLNSVQGLLFIILVDIRVQFSLMFVSRLSFFYSLFCLFPDYLPLLILSFKFGRCSISSIIQVLLVANLFSFTSGVISKFLLRSYLDLVSLEIHISYYSSCPTSLLFLVLNLVVSFRYGLWCIV